MDVNKNYKNDHYFSRKIILQSIPSVGNNLRLLIQNTHGNWYFKKQTSLNFTEISPRPK